MKNYLLLSALPIAAFAASETNIITNRPNDQGTQNSAQQPSYYGNELDNNGNEPEVRLEECCEKKEMMPMFPASARMQIACGLNLVFMGDFLYFKAKEDNLEYALQSATPVVDNVILTSSKVYRIDTEYKPGFRVGMGLLIPHDNWDIFFTWTRYQMSQSSSIAAISGETVYPLMLNQFQQPVATNAAAQWHLNFNTGDVELGRSFCAGRSFVLRPFAGARGAWIHNGLNAQYGNTFFQGRGALFSSVDVDNDSSFRAWGLRAGIDADWEFGEGWCLFVNGAASLLWSHFNVSQNDTLPDGTVMNHFNNSFHAVTPVFDMQGGLAWGHYLFKHRYFVRIHAAWEEQVWFDQNRFGRIINAVDPASMTFNQGNLSLSGLNVGIMLGF